MRAVGVAYTYTEMSHERWPTRWFCPRQTDTEGIRHVFRPRKSLN